MYQHHCVLKAEPFSLINGRAGSMQELIKQPVRNILVNPEGLAEPEEAHLAVIIFGGG
jgi:hypothetical protein